MHNLRQHLNKIVGKAKHDNKILAVFLFGSMAREGGSKKSDIDICLMMNDGAYSSLELSRKKLEYLKLFDMDIQVFQQLPIYIKARIIKEGKNLFCKDIDALYEVVFKTIREFEDFRHIYDDYLKEVACVR